MPMCRGSEFEEETFALVYREKVYYAFHMAKDNGIIRSWEFGFVTKDREVSVLDQGYMLCTLITADPQEFLKHAPAGAIGLILINTPAKIASVMPLEGGLKTENIDEAQEVLKQEYPDCRVGIQGTHFHVRERAQGVLAEGRKGR